MGESSIRQGAQIPPYVSLLAGSFSGLMARFVTAPLDVVKIRMQLQGYQPNIRYTNSLTTLSSIIKKEGTQALWKGNIPAEIMYIIYGATQFTAYSTLNTLVSKVERDEGVKITPGLHSLMLGSIAGCVSTSVSYPFDVLRTRLASSDATQFKSLAGEISKIYVWCVYGGERTH
ncbi:unnamed protein product [Ambrosiozyma monospora]|uniref:Unnamed protein product n=1 Tax=Ambrosiozyma monospora TaxID=43982 RepID=A0ACB5U912_AMBMO|nr:unnamed protein product [Ambrosiozyma monospora]